MTDKTTELMEKINAMDLDELLGFERVTKNTGRFIGVLAVGLCFLALVFMNLLSLISAGIVLYILGQLSVGVDQARLVMQERIIKLGKQKGLID